MPCYAVTCRAVPHLWHGIRCVFMRCYAMSCYSMPCYPMLCYAMLCYATLRSVIWRKKTIILFRVQNLPEVNQSNLLISNFVYIDFNDPRTIFPRNLIGCGLCVFSNIGNSRVHCNRLLSSGKRIHLLTNDEKLKDSLFEAEMF